MASRGCGSTRRETAERDDQPLRALWDVPIPVHLPSLLNLFSISRHIATIPPTERRTPGKVPEEPYGIGNKDFNDGKKVSKFGYPILELYELVEPLTLAEMKGTWGTNAPMGWCYLKKGMWESRWGDDRGDDKVKKVF